MMNNNQNLLDKPIGPIGLPPVICSAFATWWCRGALAIFLGGNAGIIAVLALGWVDFTPWVAFGAMITMLPACIAEDIFWPKSKDNPHNV